MRLTIHLFTCIIVFLFVSACGSDTTTNTAPTKKVDTSSYVGDSAQTKATKPRIAEPECAVKGKVLPTNKLWLPKRNLLAYILADSTTYTEQHGDGHRVFSLVDATSCAIVDRHVLPATINADYAYYLPKINYNKTSELIAIRGPENVYCYDLETREMSPKLSPKFDLERLAEDAQSGVIQRIELWENYLVGYAQDKGVFVFDLTNKEKPKAIMPIAEYEVSDSEYASLFALPTDEGNEQLILPYFQFDGNEFIVNPLLDQPAKVNLTIAKSAKNNRFIVLRMNDDEKTPIAIDMKQYKAQVIPAEMLSKTTQDIIKWMKALQSN